MAYVTLAQVRALPGVGTDIIDDPAVTAAIAWFEERFEEFTQLAWAPRATTAKVTAGNGGMPGGQSGESGLAPWGGTYAGLAGPRLLLPRYPVISIQSISYLLGSVSTPFTPAELADVQFVWADGETNTGELYRASRSWWPYGPLTVGYTHGRATTPLDVQDACLVAVQDKLQQDRTNARGNRQYAIATEVGVIRSSMPGKDRPFGIPAVDEVANRRRLHRAPAVG